MDISLREGYARWRELGVRRGTAAAVRRSGTKLRGPFQRARLRMRPHRLRPGELADAIGPAGAPAILRGRVLAAMPTVAEFDHSLDNLSKGERADLLKGADQIAEHTFDLLGSGPTPLGPRIDWSCDFKTGRRWPRDHISRVRISYPDGSDIKVPWELSRVPAPPAARRRVSPDR